MAFLGLIVSKILTNNCYLLKDMNLAYFVNIITKLDITSYKTESGFFMDSGVFIFPIPYKFPNYGKIPNAKKTKQRIAGAKALRSARIRGTR